MNADQKARTQLFVSLFLVLDTLAITISVPYFVDFVIKGLGETAETASILIAIRAGCTMFAAPALGGLSDRIGRKPVALIVSIGAIVTMILELVSTDFKSYTLSRVTFGLTRAAMPVANGVLCDLFTSAEERSQAMAKNGAAVGVGFLMGAALGGTLVGFGFHIPTLVCLVAQIANVGVVLMLWKETATASSSKTERPSFLRTLSAVASNDATSAVFAVHMLIVSMNFTLQVAQILHQIEKLEQIAAGKQEKKQKTKKNHDHDHDHKQTKMNAKVAVKEKATKVEILATAGVQHAFLEYTRIQLNMSPGLRSAFLLSVGILSAVMQSNLNKIIGFIGGRHRAMVIGCFLNAIINIIAPMSDAPIFIAVSLISTFVGYMPNLTLSILSKLSPQSVQGSIMGLNESLINIGTIIGPLFCSYTASIDYRIPFFTASLLLFSLMYKCNTMSEFDQKDGAETMKASTKVKKAE